MNPGSRHHGAHLIYQASEDTNVNAAEAVPHPSLSAPLAPSMVIDRMTNLKTAIRANAKRMRAGASEMLGFQAADDAATHGMQLLENLDRSSVIGAYWPIRDELDPRFLMQQLEKAGFSLALPEVVAKDKALVFRRWGLGDGLVPGMFGTEQPSGDAPIVVPDVLIVPLLAFDGDCYRLGYGAGHYDRTLAAHPHIKAFGFAYGAQFVEDVAKEAHDWPLQAVITEAGTVLPRVK